MRHSLTLLAVTVALLATAEPALADVHVGRHQVVNELRVIGQDVTIDGTARGPVFVVGGNLTVGPTGQAANVTVILGQIRTAPGAQLHGDVFQFGGPSPELNGWRLAAVLLAAFALRTLLVWIAVAAGLRLVATGQMQALTATLRDRPARTAVAGVLASAALLALSFLLLLTVVGVPIALMIWGLLIVTIPLGVATLSDLLPEPPRTRSLVLLAAIPVVGDALLALAMAVGTGALLRVIARARPNLDASPVPRY